MLWCAPYSIEKNFEYFAFGFSYSLAWLRRAESLCLISTALFRAKSPVYAGPGKLARTRVCRLPRKRRLRRLRRRTPRRWRVDERAANFREVLECGDERSEVTA
jgi:hypothetical protein